MLKPVIHVGATRRSVEYQGCYSLYACRQTRQLTLRKNTWSHRDIIDTCHPLGSALRKRAERHSIGIVLKSSPDAIWTLYGTMISDEAGRFEMLGEFYGDYGMRMSVFIADHSFFPLRAKR